MSRRIALAGLILVVAIWSGVLVTPSLRLILRGQLVPVSNLEQRRERERSALEQLAREYPNDPRVLDAEFESRRNPNLSEDFIKARLRHYDQLNARFPNEVWLIQSRLRLSTMGIVPFDRGDPAPQQRLSRIGKPWLSRAEILQAMKIAERGVRLDPQNSFYDWMRGYFYFALQQPDAALKALADGARKPHFDDGVLHAAQIQIEVASMMGPQLWEDRMLTTASMLLPHYAILLNVNRAAIWRGVLAERDANHKRALEIYGAQMKLLKTWRRDTNMLIGVMVAENMLRTTWARGGKNDSGNLTSEKIQQQMREFSHDFAAYAEKHGRGDLAHLALSLAQDEQYEILRKTQLQSELLFGAETRSNIWRIGQMKWSGAVLLRAAVLLAVAWICLSVVSLGIRGARVLPPTLDVMASALFSAVTFAVVFVVALRLGVTRQDFLWTIFFSDDSAGINDKVLRVITPYFETILTWMSLVLVVIHCVVAMLWRTRKNRAASSPSKNVAARDSSTSAQIKSGLRWSAIFVGVLAICFLAVSWFFSLLNLPTIGINNEIYFLTVAPLVLAALVLFLWRQRKTRFRDWPYLLAWVRSTLGVLVVVMSIAYICSSLVVLPLRHAADARLDDFIARGEIAVLRDLARKSKE